MKNSIQLLLLGLIIASSSCTGLNETLTLNNDGSGIYNFSWETNKDHNFIWSAIGSKMGGQSAIFDYYNPAINTGLSDIDFNFMDAMSLTELEKQQASIALKSAKVILKKFEDESITGKVNVEFNQVGDINGVLNAYIKKLSIPNTSNIEFQKADSVVLKKLEEAKNIDIPDYFEIKGDSIKWTTRSFIGASMFNQLNTALNLEIMLSDTYYSFQIISPKPFKGYSTNITETQKEDMFIYELKVPLFQFLKKEISTDGFIVFE